MLAGTGSSVGKSLLVAGLARAALRRGLRVRPFKPQNMSNNAAVAANGGEIGRAQALQARAAGIAPSVHMNPVLLKPQSETGAQVIVQGRVAGTAAARAFQAMKPGLLPRVLESFATVSDGADLVLVEGAGSVAEINLRAGDIANMGFARAADVPVVLVGDIDRGGVIASLVGTHAVLDPDDAALVAGFVVNRMRGDPSLFAAGMDAIAARTGWPALGLVPHFSAARDLPAEDAVDLAERRRPGAPLCIAVPVLPFIANSDDLDPLAAEPGVDLRLVRPGTPLPVCDLVILPGSKSTLADLAALRAEGWDIDIAAHRRRGGHVLGLCGGYQMLGRRIADPAGMEGRPGEAPGLGLLDVETVLGGDKQVREVGGRLGPPSAGIPIDDRASIGTFARSALRKPQTNGFSRLGLERGPGAAPLACPDVHGYEIHLGRTTGPDTHRPMLHLADGRPDGAVSEDGRVSGCYLHGLFTADAARAAWLAALGGTSGLPDHAALIEATLDALAAHLEAHIDVARLFSLAR